MTTGAKIGVAVAVAGGAAAVTGIVLAILARKKSGGLGRSGVPVVGRTSAGGRTLTHHRARNLPIEKRLGLVQEQIWKSVQNPENRKQALALTNHCPARDGRCEARAIDAWMRANIRYTGDVAPVKMGKNGPVEAIDLFQTADFTAEVRGGDCDDHAIFGATMLSLNGITARLRVTSPNKNKKDWRHIYVVAGLPKEHPTQWVALDSTLPNAFFGDEAMFAKFQDFQPSTSDKMVAA